MTTNKLPDSVEQIAYKNMLGKNLHGDCRKVVHNIPDNALACCIIDPPYGEGIAASQAGRQFICIEKKEIHWKTATKRLADHNAKSDSTTKKGLNT